MTMLGMLIKQHNPSRQIINLKEYKIDPRDFEDTPERPESVFKRPFKKERPLITAREQEVATLFCVGYTAGEIKRALNLPHTNNLGSCIARVREKLGVWDREQIAQRLKFMGIVLPPPPKRDKNKGSGLRAAVRQALNSEMPVPFQHKGNSRNLVIRAGQYAEEMGGKIAVRTIDDKIWIFRRAARNS